MSTPVSAADSERTMGKEIYPIASRPEHLYGKGKPRTWTDDIARSNFDWLMSVRKERVQILLSFFQLRYPERGDEYKFLSTLGDIVAKAISNEPNYREESGKRQLTAPGLSIAHDVGLLVAELIIASSDERIFWKLHKTRRDALSYNLPVLAGVHPRMTLDPIRGSITGAKGILDGNQSANLWAETYRFWLTTLTSQNLRSTAGSKHQRKRDHGNIPL